MTRTKGSDLLTGSFSASNAGCMYTFDLRTARDSWSLLTHPTGQEENVQTGTEPGGQIHTALLFGSFHLWKKKTVFNAYIFNILHYD
jgi:hypothetical protein